MKNRVISSLLIVCLFIAAFAGCAPKEVPHKTDANKNNSEQSTLNDSKDNSSDTTVSDNDTSSVTDSNNSSAVTPPIITPKPVDTTVTSTNYVTWFENALTDIFEDTKKNVSSMEKGHIDVMKNECESIQIGVYAATEDLVNLKVDVKQFEGENAPEVTVMPIRLVYNSTESIGFKDGVATYERGESPGYFPEYYDSTNSALGVSSGMDYKILKNTSAAALIEVQTTANTIAGDYNTTVLLTNDKEIREIPISVKVWDVTIPEPKDSNFTYTNWFKTCNNVEVGEFYSFMDIYGAAEFNENFFTVIKNYATVMKKERQNTITIPINALLASDMKFGPNGELQFTFKNFDRFIEAFMQYGSIKYLEGYHFYSKDYYIETGSETKTGSLVTPIIIADENGRPKTKWVFVETDEANRFFEQLIPALYNHIKEKGWHKIWLQHVCDEPLSKTQYEQINRMYKRILSEMPGVRTIDAGSGQIEKFGKENALSIYCPQLDSYESSRTSYNEISAADNGIDVMFYTCVNPQDGNVMTRIADYPLLSHRIIGWYQWQQGVKGYLHWAWNSWDKPIGSTNDPATNMYCKNAAADGFLVYPDYLNLSVFEGPRATATRDSWEDYELLTIAASKNNSAVRELLNGIVRNSKNFIRSNIKLLETRKKLLEIASK